MTRAKGFSLVELAVVIAVIAILLTIGTVFYVVQQQGARNSTREVRATLIANALEKYYDNNGEYPLCSALQAADAPTTLGVDPDVIKTPRGTGSNNMFCNPITLTTNDVYAYLGTTCSSACAKWTLSYREEGGSSAIKTLTSKR